MPADLLTALQTVTFAAGSPNAPRDLVFTQFDPTLGTLRGVAISMTVDLAGSAAVENLQLTPAQVTGGLAGAVQLLQGGTSLLTANVSATATASLAGYDGTTDAAGPSGTVFAALTGHATSGGDLSYFGGFSGAGTVTLSYAPQVQASVSGGGNLFAATQAVLGGAVSLQYIYTPSIGAVLTTTSDGAGLTTWTGVFDNFFSIIGSATTATQTRSIASQTTDWSGVLTFDKFDASLGTLLGVDVTVHSLLDGSLQAENLGVAGQIGATVAGTVRLSPPNATAVTATATAGATATLAAFDGTADYAGSSGTSIASLASLAAAVDGHSVLAASAGFTGPGTIDLAVTGTATGAISGVADLLAILRTQAGATVDLHYVYQPNTPANLLAACYAAGTRIRTPRGDIPIEAIRPGAQVLTLSGTPAEVIWTGRRTVAPARHPRPWDVNPVHIAPHAFAPGQPARELVLSPDHAVFVAGRLIPVRHLLNGATIVQLPADKVTWHHLELAAHDVILAEGLPGETYLDTGNRGAFEGEAVMHLHPRFAAEAMDIWATRACAPLLRDGPDLADVKTALLRRAGEQGWRMTADPAAELHVAGRILRSPLVDGALHFPIPAGAERATLVSRRAVPAEIRPDSDDHRRLGLAVVEMSDFAEAQTGWHQAEPGWRWTDGAATLSLWGAMGGARTLTVRIAALIGYWVPPSSPSRSASQLALSGAQISPPVRRVTP